MQTMYIVNAYCVYYDVERERERCEIGDWREIKGEEWCCLVVVIGKREV